jgi:hypothetical protein
VRDRPGAHLQPGCGERKRFAPARTHHRTPGPSTGDRGMGSRDTACPQQRL